MKKIIIGIIASLITSRIIKTEMTLMIFKAFTSVNEELDALPSVTLEALQSTVKDLKENRDLHAERLVRKYRGNMKQMFKDMYRTNLIEVLKNRKIGRLKAMGQEGQKINNIVSSPGFGGGPSTPGSAGMSLIEQELLADRNRAMRRPQQ